MEGSWWFLVGRHSWPASLEGCCGSVAVGLGLSRFPPIFHTCFFSFLLMLSTLDSLPIKSLCSREINRVYFCCLQTAILTVWNSHVGKVFKHWVSHRHTHTHTQTTHTLPSTLHSFKPCSLMCLRVNWGQGLS